MDDLKITFGLKKDNNVLTPEMIERLNNDSIVRELRDLRVFVIGGGFQYIKMFHDAGFKGARSVDDADIICFTGGEDVDPSLYGEKPLACTGFNTLRDEYESGIYGECLALQKPMIGICRGGQFLNVMNCGTLWQDVNNHAVGRGHDIIDMRDGSKKGPMTSTHHQMMRPAKGAEILAVASEATRKESASEKITGKAHENDDTEVVWYPDTLCLCFQPHPEFFHGACRDFFLDLVDDYILPAC